MIKYNVGDLFQAKGDFIGEWINYQTFLLVKIDYKKEDPFTLVCQANGRTLQTTSFTLQRDMVKLNDV